MVLGFGVAGLRFGLLALGVGGVFLIFRGKTGFWQFGGVKSLGCGFTGLVSFGTRFEGLRLQVCQVISLLVGYHGELKVNLFQNTRVIYGLYYPKRLLTR